MVDTPIGPITRGGIYTSLPPQVFDNGDGTRTYVYWDNRGPYRSERRDAKGRLVPYGPPIPIDQDDARATGTTITRLID